MNLNEICDELIKVFPNKEEKIKCHKKDYGEILGHIFFGEEINEPLIDLLDKYVELGVIQKYCNFIEKMWKKGNEDVVNIVNVTIIERLSDKEDIWNKFGENISQEFREYINKELIPSNSMMKHVKQL